MARQGQGRSEPTAGCSVSTKGDQEEAKMAPSTSRAEYCRQHAYHAKRLAKLTRDPDLKRYYETIAREFESLLAEIDTEESTAEN